MKRIPIIRIFKDITFPFIVLFQLLAYNNVIFGQTDYNEKLPQYPLKSVKTVCQNDTTELMNWDEYYYDKDKLLIKSKSLKPDLYYTGIPYKDSCLYNYNIDGVLISRIVWSTLENNSWVCNKLIYNYDENHNLLSQSSYGKENSFIFIYHYNNIGQRISYYEVCNPGTVYNFTYDKQGNLSKSYRNSIAEFSYVYDQAKLTKRIRYINNDSVETIYEYDTNGILLHEVQDGKELAEYVYDKNRLIEKWQYNYEIDRGFSPCGGNYLTIYKYY